MTWTDVGYVVAISAGLGLLLLLAHAVVGA